MFRRAVETRLARRLVLFFSLFPFAVTGACAHEQALVRHPGGSASAPAVQWFGPNDATDEAPLARWRSAVGPPVLQQGENPSDTPADDLTVVSWNTAVGAGDVRRFVAGLRRPGPVVLLLQEVYRGGEEVPGVLPPGAAYASRLGGRPGDSRYEQIEPIARALGLSLFYVPSMRNGGPESREDRGNAILSSLPLSDLAAYELPFERQRRVALAATIGGTTTTGARWRLRIVDAHLDNTFSPRRLWLASEYRPDAPGALPGRDTRHRGAADPRRRLQHLVRIFGSGLSHARPPISRRAPGRPPADVPGIAAARSPVLQARARLERNLSARGRSVPVGSLSIDRHRPLPTLNRNLVEPRRTP